MQSRRSMREEDKYLPKLAQVGRKGGLLPPSFLEGMRRCLGFPVASLMGLHVQSRPPSPDQMQSHPFPAPPATHPPPPQPPHCAGLPAGRAAGADQPVGRRQAKGTALRAERPAGQDSLGDGWAVEWRLGRSRAAGHLLREHLNVG